MEREKAHWERGREEWVRENRREEEEGEGRRKVGKLHNKTSVDYASLVRASFSSTRWSISSDNKVASISFYLFHPMPILRW